MKHRAIAVVVMIALALVLPSMAALAEDSDPDPVASPGVSVNEDSIPAVQGAPSMGATQDAAVTFSVFSEYEWQEPEIYVNAGTRYVITWESGSWTVDYNNLGYVGPGGYDQSTDQGIGPECKYVSSVQYGTLLTHVIGDDVLYYFPVGANSITIEPDVSGYLEFRINDDVPCLVDNDGSIEIAVEQERPSCSEYTAEYFNNVNATGTPALVRCEGWPIDWEWDYDSPSEAVNSDGFSARWTGAANITAGTYEFRLHSDDGSRVWFNNELIFDQWDDPPYGEVTVRRTVANGNYPIRVEYREISGAAHAFFRWDRVTETPPTITGFSANPSSPTANQSFTLTATASTDLSSTPYYITIWESSTRHAVCGSGTTCSVALTKPAGAYTFQARISDINGGNIQSSRDLMVTVGSLPPPPPPPAPSDIIPPDGTWISPTADYVVTNNQVHFAAHAYDNEGGSGIAYVNFTARYGGSWRIICSDATPNPRTDVYECDGILTDAPAGPLDVSFDVYDQAGNHRLAPNGKRQISNTVPFVCIGGSSCNGVPHPTAPPPEPYNWFQNAWTVVLNGWVYCGLELTPAKWIEYGKELKLLGRAISLSENWAERKPFRAFVDGALPGGSCITLLVDVIAQGQLDALDRCIWDAECRALLVERIKELTSFIGVWEVSDRSSAGLLAAGVATAQARSQTWLWGPVPNTAPTYEYYVSAASGSTVEQPLYDWRVVIYFDKSRMEINNSSGDPTSEWYVTNGLLATELITGQMQMGDATWLVFDPAEVNVAGDYDDASGPTYRTFNVLRGYAPFEAGGILTQRTNRDSATWDDGSMAQYGVTAAYLDTVTNHSVASPFWDFMNSTGYDSPFYVTGRPIAEAYWANVKVGGTYKDVLMQCFERRCMTYTPDNAPEWQVEAGNVGLHYYIWRYGQMP